MSDSGQPEEQATQVALPSQLEPTQGVPSTPAPGQVLAGRYTVLELLGKGGMGVVLAAYDVRLDRRVALKLLSPERAGSESLQARLLREAQAMARLNHPHVVHVYDSGTLEGGRLFIAMEYVQGQTLKLWSQERGRTWRQVLEAYLAAGRGLAAAHVVGLVHRDFKPDNVLVGEDGRVRVTDFGVARAEATQPPQELLTPLPGGAWQGELTLPGMLVGTPRYMAPELLLGQPADVRSDLFAYCLALWEALYRQPAFAGSSLQERAEAMAKKRPMPPAASEVPAWVGRALLRGLEVDPALRPASLGELLAALERDPRQQRQGRLRTAGLVASLALGLGGLMAVGWAQYREHALACTRMEQRLAGVWDEAVRERVRQALVGTGLPYAPDTAERVLLGLEGYASQWVRLSTQVCEDSRQRAEQSRGLGVLQQACLERRRGQLQALTALLAHGPDKELLPKAVQAVQALPPLPYCADAQALTAAVPPPEEPLLRARVEALQQQLDRLAALNAAGKYQQGLQEAEAVLAEVERVDFAPLRAQALLQAALLQEGAGLYPPAEARLRQAIPLAARGGDVMTLARAWALLAGVVGVRQGRPQEALPLELTVESLAELARDDSLHATSLSMLGGVHLMLGHYEEALARYERSLALRERALGPEHPDTATSLNNLASTLDQLGRYEQARATHERALALRERALGPEHPSVAASLNNLALVLASQGRYEEALALYTRCVALGEKALGPEHPYVVTLLSNQANHLFRMGRYEQARATHERVLALRQKLLGPEHPEVAESLSNLAQSLSELGRYEEALALHTRALALAEKVKGPEHSDVARLISNLGDVLARMGRYEEALARQTLALERLQKALGAEHPHVATVLLQLGELRLRQRRPAQALPLLERALALAPQKLRAESRLLLARALWDSGSDRRRAVQLATQAHAYWQGLHHPRQAEAAQWLAAHPSP